MSVRPWNYTIDVTLLCRQPEIHKQLTLALLGLDQSNFNFARDGGSLMPEGWCSLSSQSSRFLFSCFTRSDPLTKPLHKLCEAP